MQTELLNIISYFDTGANIIYAKNVNLIFSDDLKPKLIHPTSLIIREESQKPEIQTKKIVVFHFSYHPWYASEQFNKDGMPLIITFGV